MAESKQAVERRSREEWDLICASIMEANGIPLDDDAEKQAARKKRALKDYAFFAQTYFKDLATDAPADFHIDAANDKLKHWNCIFVDEWPREHAKSVNDVVITPLWMLAHEELDGFVAMCKTQEDGINQLSDIQAQLQFNELYKHDWGNHYNYGDWEAGDFVTQKGVRFKALGREQSPRGLRKGGKRPNYAVIDDIDDDEIVHNQKRVHKVLETIFGGLIPALNTKKWRLVVAGNRIHPQSILAHVVGDIKPGAPKRKGVRHSKVCAIENGKPVWSRYTLEQLYAKFDAIGPAMAQREYFHKYVIEGKVFKDKYFKWEKIKPLSSYRSIEGYFDPSFENKPTSDYKAVCVVGLYEQGQRQEYHVIKAFCKKCEFTEAYHFMWEFEKSLPPGVGIIWRVEKQFFNRPVQDALYDFNQDNRAKLSIITDTRIKENKYTRIVRMEPLFSTGKMVFNIAEMHSNDMVEGINQTKGIEPGYNGADDFPDCLEGDLHYLTQIPVRSSNSKIRQGARKHKRRY